jgi:hypothetical protein
MKNLDPPYDEYQPDEGPRFEHDCKECDFYERDGPFDVYICPRSLCSGYVWRFGAGDRFTTMPEQRLIWLQHPPTY